MGACASSGSPSALAASELGPGSAVPGNWQEPAMQLPPGPVLLGNSQPRSLRGTAPLKRPEKLAADTLYAEGPSGLQAWETGWEEEEDGAGGVLGTSSPTTHLSGWVARQRSEDSSAVERSNDFCAVLQDVRAGVHALAKRWDLLYLVVPGFFGSKYPKYMHGTRNHLKTLGLDCRIAEIDTKKSLKDNAKVVAGLTEELYVLTGKRVLLIGHSRGGCDAVAAVARHPVRLRRIVAGVVCLQTPLGGTPLADDFLGRQLCGRTVRTLRHVLGGEAEALGDFTYEQRMKELDEFPYPHSHVPILTFSSKTNRMASVLAPLANYIRRRYSLENDGMVACADAHLLGSALVAFGTDWDHGASAFPEPCSEEREELVNEAAITLLAQDLPLVTPSVDTFVTPIYDFWHHEDRDHTFHHGDPWPGEQRNHVVFYALRVQVEGTEPVYSFWNKERSEHTFHLGEPLEGEYRKSAQFFAFSRPVKDAEPVFRFWHAANSDYTIHMGEPLSGEIKQDKLFYAFRHPPTLYMAMQSIVKIDRL